MHTIWTASAIMRPPPSKADQFGTVWGAAPIYLAWGDEPRNACRALMAMELAMPVDASRRATTPLFTPDGTTAFAGATLDTLLKRLLQTFMSAADAAHYSWHSARIYLACALLAAGASAGQIQAMCRWVSEASLHIYARMNETTYVYWTQRAMMAHVNSARTTTLMADKPQTEDDECLESLVRLNLVGVE